jgi:hypothetical protein
MATCTQMQCIQQSMLVLPSSCIDQFFLSTRDHIFTSGSHSVFIYCTKLWGTEGSFEISTHSLAKTASSKVFTKAFTLAQRSRNSFVLKCDRIAHNTCHLHSKIWLSGSTILSTLICVQSQSVIITAGQTARLASLTQPTKKAMVSVVPLDMSI